MEWEIPSDERTHLRELAKKQAEYAALPVMADRTKMWYALNDGASGARPPVVIEPWTFDRDFMPDRIYRCTSPTGKAIEKQLLRNVRNHELLDDDKVVPDTFDIGFFVDVDFYGGIKVPRRTVKDFDGIETGFTWTHPIKDLHRDLHVLKPAACSLDIARTISYKAFLEDLFAGSLPVCIRSGTYARGMLTSHVIELMGMEAYFTAMYDCPDQVHQLMAYLRDNALRVMRWAEQNQLLRVNNANQASFGSSYNFTTHLPARSFWPWSSSACETRNCEPIARDRTSDPRPPMLDARWPMPDARPPTADARCPMPDARPPTPDTRSVPARLCDMWGCANSQETVGISPQMYHEFVFPYYRDTCQPVGLLYYGCCEPAHPFWEDIRRLPHLKKVSISRWCNQKMMGEALRGTDVVFSRKPDPNFLSVDRTLNEDAWAAHIRETLEATRGVFVEFIIRDVYTVHGDLNNARRCVEIARRQIDKHWHG
jgi:hypothetical protein